MSTQSLLESVRQTAEQEQSIVVDQMRAVAWARVSTDMQEERGLSLPEQLAQIRHFAQREGLEIVKEYSEAASAYQKDNKRTEFHRMLAAVKAEKSIRTILVNDFSRFSRDYDRASSLLRELKRSGIRVISVQEGELETDTAQGVWMKAITLAKNEAYSKEVSFHTLKGCKANVRTRDQETGWCYKNGGQPLFGYKTVQFTRGEERKGRSIIKSIWVPDDTLINGKPISAWARECLLMAAKGASLATLRDFCNQNGIPGRRNALWGSNTWHAILAPSSLLKYCGIEVYNVHDKHGREHSLDKWVTVDNAHEALITEEEARAILAARKANSRKCFDTRSHESRRSNYLLTGGLFVCGRCGANMIGYVNGDGKRYRCASHVSGKAFLCGPSVMARQPDLEGKVIAGLRDWLAECADPKGFTRLVNEELRKLWENASGYDPNLTCKQEAIDRKIENLRSKSVDALDDEEFRWIQQKIHDLKIERDALNAQRVPIPKVPQIDSPKALSQRKRVDAVLAAGSIEDKKALLRNCVEKVILHPENLTVEIRYQIPASLSRPIPKKTMDSGPRGTGIHCHAGGSGGGI